jgi:hypothetical protein
MFKFSIEDVKSVVHEGMTLDQVRKAMLDLMMDESTNHYRMGQLYNYVVDNRLAEKADYKDAEAYFTKHLSDLSFSSLRLYGAVAQHFSAQVSTRFGVTCLSLLLTYKEVADLEVNHEAPGDTVIEVPGENGAVTPKPFGDCSVNEMRLAIQRKRKPASSKPLSEADLELADQYRRAVTGRFPKGVPVRVQVRNNKGKAVLDFKGIPLEQVAKLSEALAVQHPPVPEVLLMENAPPVQ